MKSIFENIFIRAISEGETREDVVEEIGHSIDAHQRVIDSIDYNIDRLLVKKQEVLDDIECLISQKESINLNIAR